MIWPFLHREQNYVNLVMYPNIFLTGLCNLSYVIRILCQYQKGHAGKACLEVDVHWAWTA